MVSSRLWGFAALARRSFFSVRAFSDLRAAAVFIGTIVDPVADCGWKKPRTTNGEHSGQNARPLIEHEQNVEQLRFGGTEGHRTVVFEEDELGRYAMGGAEFARESETGSM